MMSNQEIFDKVVRHLSAQGLCAMLDGTCAYRGDGGLKCAVGCLIPDGIYHEDIEGKNVKNLFNNFPDQMKASGLDPKSADLLTDLQRIHDNRVKRDWKRNLLNVAEHYHLDDSIVKSSDWSRCA